MASTSNTDRDFALLAAKRKELLSLLPQYRQTLEYIKGDGFTHFKEKIMAEIVELAMQFNIGDGGDKAIAICAMCRRLAGALSESSNFIRRYEALLKSYIEAYNGINGEMPDDIEEFK